MMSENGRDGEEPRGLPRVSEQERPGTRSDDTRRETRDDWYVSGTEDPAFFIKPSDGE